MDVTKYQISERDVDFFLSGFFRDEKRSFRLS